MRIGGMEMNKKSASPKKTAPIACRIVSCSSTVAVGACNGWDRCRETMHPYINGLSDSGVRRDYMAVACAYLPHDAVVIFVVGVVFFRRSRLFFREATFFSQR